MAFPYIFEANFEGGTNAEFDSESDTGSRLDFPHYTTLAQIPGMPAPYRGAYCMRIVMGDTNDHTLIEGDIDIADTVTRYSRFMLYVGTDVAATADDTFNIYEVQGTANAVENAVGLRITASTDVVEIGVGNTAPTVFSVIPKGKWLSVELISVIQTGGTGTATLQVDGGQVAQVTTLTNTAVLRGVLGTQDTLSTTTGTLLFDQFAFDDTQLYPITQRFTETVFVTKSGHLFVGAGRVENASLLAGAATDGVLSIYDTDTANTNDVHNLKLELKNVTNSDIVDPAGVPIDLYRGCYVTLAGTTPRAMVKISPRHHFSDGAIRAYGQRRKARAQNV